MIDLLKRYFERRGDVALAFLFGSSARGLDGRDSDVDIAIYLTEKGEEDRIWREVSRILEREVDLVLLNDAPATLISKVFKTGIPLVIKDRRLYWDLYLTKTLEAEDFSQFAEDYWKIYSRSTSLIPEDKARLLESKEEKHRKVGRERYQCNNRHRQDNFSLREEGNAQDLSAGPVEVRIVRRT